MKIRYFDLGLHSGLELADMQNFLPQISDDYELYGFEAAPTHFDKYCLKYANDNTKVYNCAISDCHNSVTKLFFSKNQVGHSIHSSKNNVDENKYFDVQTIKFSEWLKDNNIDLKDSLNILKINIEGAEWEFFNDIVDTGINKHIHIYCGAGHDVQKVQKFVDNEIVNKYYKLINENNIILHRWVIDWKPERNANLHLMIKEKYEEQKKKLEIYTKELEL